MPVQLRRQATRPAFTLIELLVIIAIVAILIGLTACAVMRVRVAAVRVQCAERLRQIGLALHSYHGTHSTFPPGTTREFDAGQHRYMSWHTRILPYMEQDGLWKQAVEAYEVQPNFILAPHPHDVVMRGYECPVDPRSGKPGIFAEMHFGLTSFLGVSGTDFSRQDGIFFVDSRIRLTDITDGSSQTLLVGERPPSSDMAFGWWYAGGGQLGGTGSADHVLGTLERNYSYRAPDCPIGPYEFGPGDLKNMCDTFHFWSLHPGGAHFVMADGSVHFLSYSARSVLPDLATRAGGEVAEVP